MNTSLQFNQTQNQFVTNLFGCKNSTSSQKDNLIDSIASDFKDNLYWKSVYKNLKTDATYDIWIYEGYTKTKKETKFTSYPYDTVQFSIGDYISYVNENGNTQIFLITMINDINTFEVSGTLQECNFILKFQSPTNGAILSYPCITSSIRFSQDENKIISVGNNKKSILCCFDSETLQIRNTESKTWRFYVDRKLPIPTAYRLTGDTETTEFNYGDHGLIEMIVEQDVAQADDRVDLGICNYYSSTETPTTNTYSIITANGELYLNYERVLTGIAYDNGIVNSEVNLVWTWTLPIGFESKFTITSSGNTCNIKVVDNTYSVLGEDVIFNVADSNGGYVGQLIITVNSM
jgi:hypothetical protein